MLGVEELFTLVRVPASFNEMFCALRLFVDDGIEQNTLLIEEEDTAVNAELATPPSK